MLSFPPSSTPLLGPSVPLSRLPASGARRSVPPHDRSAGNDWGTREWAKGAGYVRWRAADRRGTEPRTWVTRSYPHVSSPHRSCHSGTLRSFTLLRWGDEPCEWEERSDKVRVVRLVTSSSRFFRLSSHSSPLPAPASVPRFPTVSFGASGVRRLRRPLRGVVKERSEWAERREAAVTEATKVGTEWQSFRPPSISAASRLVTLTLQPLLLSHEIDGVRKEKERLTAIMSVSSCLRSPYGSLASRITFILAYRRRLWSETGAAVERNGWECDCKVRSFILSLQLPRFTLGIACQLLPFHSLVIHSRTFTNLRSPSVCLSLTVSLTHPSHSTHPPGGPEGVRERSEWATDAETGGWCGPFPFLFSLRLRPTSPPLVSLITP